MHKRILTIEDLFAFCREQKFTNFSARESGYKLSVQVPAQLQINKENNDDSLLFCLVKLMHSQKNRNQSCVTDEALEKASKTLAYKPLLADFVEYTDPVTGDKLKDFTSHAMEFNDDGSVTYLERQIGCFTADKPYFEVEKDTGHNFLYGYCAIPREYTDACKIIERKNGTKVSVELEVNEMQYSVENQMLELTDIVIMGATCLGKNPDTLDDVEEGMKNARLDIVDFSVNNNSLFVNYDMRLVELQDRLARLESACFNNKESENSKEGGTEDMFEKLLEQYGKTVEDIDFDYADLSDEELMAKFAEVFGESSVTESVTDNPSDEAESFDDSESAEQFEGHEPMIRSFEVSHDDIKRALYELLAQYEAADNDCYFIMEVYDSWFAYESCYTNVIYGQKYAILDEIVQFEGERYNLHHVLLTDSEYAELEAMRSNYAGLKSFKETTEANELHARRENILSDEKYSMISVKDSSGRYINADFAALVADMDNYSVEDLETKVKVLHSDYVSEHRTFEVSTDEPVESKSVRRFSSVKNKPKKRYGNLFD